jgi:hypothetical protein
VGKRLVDDETFGQYLGLGNDMKAAGNRAFAAQDFDMALTRWAASREATSSRTGISERCVMVAGTPRALSS